MVVPGSATEGFPEEMWAMGASSGCALPRLIFQKSCPFLRLLVRGGSVSSEEALCVNPGRISPWKRLSHCLRPDLGGQGSLSPRIWGSALAFIVCGTQPMTGPDPCFTGMETLLCVHWVTSDSMSQILYNEDLPGNCPSEMSG